MLEREGLQSGAWQCALAKSVPRLASRSMFGVFAWGWPPRQPTQSFRSSTARKRMLGAPLGAASGGESTPPVVARASQRRGRATIMGGALPLSAGWCLTLAKGEKEPTGAGEASTPLEVFLDNPVRLPLVGFPDVSVETHLFGLRILDRERLPVAQLRSPRVHQGGEPLNLRSVLGEGGEVAPLIRVFGQVEQLTVVDRRVHDQL